MTSGSTTASLSELIDIVAGVDADDPEALKTCCASVYGSDVMSLLLGDSYHPGGADLTRRLADAIGLQPGERVLDVASGIGTTALLLVAERGVDVLGVDLGDAQVFRARERAAIAGMSDRARFQRGDAERLPISDGAFDAVVCECALCTFPSKSVAVAEFARVVRPGGRIGITDVWLQPDRLDPELRGLAGRIACVADARPIDEMTALVESAGLVVSGVERHDAALAEAVDRVTTRLRALRLLDIPLLRSFDVSRAIDLAHRVTGSIERGDAGYVLLTAMRP